MTTPEPTTTDYLRNADLAELASTLQEHRTRAVDFVIPADRMVMRDGALIVDGIEPNVEITDDGVTTTNVNGRYRPTAVGLRGLASTLDVPIKYVRRMAADNVPLLDANVNSWLAHPSMAGRKHLYRALVNPVGDPNPDGFDGVIRAVLSDSYRCIDNFDVLMATLSGIRAMGVENPVVSADLTETRMVVRVTAPGVAIHAPELLRDYRNPFGDGERVPGGWTPEQVARAAGIEGMGYAPGTEPIVFAGFQITNSETGGGAFSITPRLEVMVCRNGLTIVADATREIHLGAKLDAGMIEWSDETRWANAAMVHAQTKDVVRRFLSPDYVQSKVTELEKNAGIPVKPSDAPVVVQSVGKALSWTASEQSSILDYFMAGGQYTAGGVMQAATAAAQDLPGDAAYDMEAQAVRVLHLAGRAAGKS